LFAAIFVAIEASELSASSVHGGCREFNSLRRDVDRDIRAYG